MIFVFVWTDFQDFVFSLGLGGRDAYNRKDRRLCAAVSLSLIKIRQKLTHVIADCHFGGTPGGVAQWPPVGPIDPFYRGWSAAVAEPFLIPESAAHLRCVWACN